MTNTHVALTLLHHRFCISLLVFLSFSDTTILVPDSTPDQRPGGAWIPSSNGSYRGLPLSSSSFSESKEDWHIQTVAETEWTRCDQVSSLSMATNAANAPSSHLVYSAVDCVFVAVEDTHQHWYMLSYSENKGEEKQSVWYELASDFLRPQEPPWDAAQRIVRDQLGLEIKSNSMRDTDALVNVPGDGSVPLEESSFGRFLGRFRANSIGEGWTFTYFIHHLDVSSNEHGPISDMWGRMRQPVRLPKSEVQLQLTTGQITCLASVATLERAVRIDGFVQ
jgi:hypothetical protein